MEAFFKELFGYNHNANQKLLSVFTEHPDKISERSVKLMSHILNAHQIWNNRIEKRGESFSVWQIHSLAYLKDIDDKNFATSLEILERVDLERTVEYVNSQGKAFRNAAKDILFHVTNHSTYHRGQIAADFVQTGITPVITDYIFYKR